MLVFESFFWLRRSVYCRVRAVRRTVRDRLCQIIRQHELDPNLVKHYAVDFCGVKTLRDATRDQVENFVQHLGYLRTTITEEQRQEFGELVEDTIRRIQSAQFLPHSGRRFPWNPCSMSLCGVLSRAARSR
jgi:hypothetical protein